MRVAALYDIHGNLPALEAVLDEIRHEKVDHIVVGGDVLPGPMPRETLACLLTLDTPVQFIVGNGDRVVLEQRAGKESDEVPGQFREVIRWTAEQLYPEYERLLASWPLTVAVEISGLGEVLFSMPHRATTPKYLHGSRRKIAFCQCLNGSGNRWSCAVTRTCSLTEW